MSDPFTHVGKQVLSNGVHYADAADDRAAAFITERLNQRWQPMESAPDDGTEFLAAIEVHNTRGGKWWERHVVSIDDETGRINDGVYQGWDREDYSHWAPLLPAPVSA